jgi:hypothetical protein
MVLAKFFKVHPGYLVDDPEGYHVELQSDVARARGQAGSVADQRGGAVPRRSGALRLALLAVARHAESRRCLLLLNAIIETPGLVDRLFDVLHSPEDNGRATRLARPPVTQSARRVGAGKESKEATR